MSEGKSKKRSTHIRGNKPREQKRKIDKAGRGNARYVASGPALATKSIYV